MDTPLVVHVWREMILQVLGSVLPVLPVEFVPHYDSGDGLPWELWKGEFTLVSVLGKSDLVDLREMILLDHR